MAPERGLSRLLATLDPVLHPDVLVYATVPTGEPVVSDAVFAVVAEAEATTVVLLRSVADERGLASTFPCRRIELRVHSALDAVGLTAAVAGALADAGLSANVIAGAHHDHLLVAADAAEDALAVVQDLVTRSAG